MFWGKVAIADGESGDEGEVESLVEPPTLYSPDYHPGPDHYQEDPRQDWPDHVKLLDKLSEEQTPHPP